MKCRPSCWRVWPHDGIAACRAGDAVIAMGALGQMRSKLASSAFAWQGTLAVVRRRCAACGLCLLFALVAAPLASAGNQKEEAMADSVRIALSRAISDSSPPVPTFSDRKQQLDFQNWLLEMSARLHKRMTDRQTRM
jgi:hypothetical protein